MATFEIVIDGQTFLVKVGDVSRSPVTVVVNGVEKTVTFREVAEVQATAPSSAPVSQASEPAAPPQAPTPAPTPTGAVEGEAIKAPMPGKIISIRVKVGDTVKEGDTVCTLEAMKMEMPITTTVGGTVKAIHVSEGQNVAYDAPLVTIG